MEWFYYGCDLIFTAVNVWVSFQLLSISEPRLEQKNESIIKGIATLGLAAVSVYNDIVFVKGVVSSGNYLLNACVIGLLGMALYRIRFLHAICMTASFWALSALLDFFVMMMFYVGLAGENERVDILLKEGNPRGVYLLIMSIGFLWAAKSLKTTTGKSILEKFYTGKRGYWKRAVFTVVLWGCVIYFQRVYWKVISEQFLLNWLLFLLLFFFIGIGMIVYDMVRKSREQKQLVDMNLEAMEKRYLNLLEEQKEKAAFLHDIKNHVMTVQGLLENEEEKTALKYIRQMAGELSQGENRVWSNHAILDLILNEKRKEAHSRQIQMDIECEDMSDLTLRPVDICALCSNILDNAIEANMKQETEKRWIRFVCKRQNAMVIFFVSNPADRRIDRRDGIPETTKSDKGKHGLGLYSVRKILDRSDGHMDFYTEGGVFHMMIGLVGFTTEDKPIEDKKQPIADKWLI